MATKKPATKRKMSSTAKTKLAKVGSTIMTAAKKIRKENSNKKWTDCVKAAGKLYKKLK